MVLKKSNNLQFILVRRKVVNQIHVTESVKCHVNYTINEKEQPEDQNTECVNNRYALHICAYLCVVEVIVRTNFSRPYVLVELCSHEFVKL